MINETRTNNLLQTTSPAYVGTHDNQLTHRILVSPKFRKDGRYWCIKAGPLFEARYEGELICSSTQPLLDSAKVLKARGLKGTIEQWNVGTDYASLTMPIEAAADLTIEEGERRPRFVVYTPFQGRGVNVQATTLPAHPQIAAGALTAVEGIDSRILL